MSKQFNPYHSWLGIPAEEQPPNHYRLLGIPLFEANEDVIQNGLDQRMAHIKSFATGPHGAVSQRLLTELSQAGVCLLRPEKKQLYDKQLQAELKANAETVALQSAPAPAAAPPRQVSAAPPRQTAPPNEAAVQAAVAVNQVNGLEQGKAAASGFPIVPTIVGSAIGLAVAGVVLFMLSSWGRPDVTAAQQDLSASGPELIEAVDGGDTSAVEPKPPEGENGEAAPVVEPEPESQPPDPAPEGPPQPKETQPAPSPFQATNVPPPNWPTALPGSPFVKQPADTVPPADSLPPTPDTSSRRDLATKSIVLDLERSAMYVTLAEDAEDKEVQAQIQTITSLGTPYSLRPDDGIVRLRQSVDVELTEYAGVKIRLSMRMRGKNAELEVVPEIETEQGKTTDFSMKKLENARRSLKKKGVTVSNNLGARQREILMIQNAMKQPAPAPVRTAQKQRITLLTQQTIPALQQQMAYLQGRDEVLRQLALLVKQIHEKASVNLVVQEVKPAGAAE